MNDAYRYKILTKYHAAKYYANRGEHDKFKKHFGQTIEEYKRTAECKEAHELEQGFRRG